jgi:hypothetical protein
MTYHDLADITLAPGEPIPADWEDITASIKTRVCVQCQQPTGSQHYCLRLLGQTVQDNVGETRPTNRWDGRGDDLPPFFPESQPVRPVWYDGVNLDNAILKESN